MFERWETGTTLSGARQSTEVTKLIDVNSSDGERGLLDTNHNLIFKTESWASTQI